MTSLFPYIAIAAPLDSYAFLSSNIVNTNSSYEIRFTTKTTGTIKTIDIGFTDHFNTQSAKLIEIETDNQTIDISQGSLSFISGAPPDAEEYTSTIQYTVKSPVSIPAGTLIKLKISNITNPSVAGYAYSLLVTTKDHAGNTIDGPSETKTFTIKEAGL
jgi:hypothetical protein